MMPALRTPRLIERLPPVRGRLDENVPLASIAWFRVGGPAEVMFRPADRDDLCAFLAARPGDVPVTVVGLASNLLVRDGGVPGVVIRLGRAFAEIEIGGGIVLAGGGASDINVSRAAGEAGIGGLEFLSGIPGAIGGAVRMNAGAYEREIRDVLIEAEAVDAYGRVHRADASALGFTFRHCDAPEDWIFTAARLRGTPDSPGRIAERMSRIASARKESQPIRTRTGGSTFKNPPGRKAWELIEQAGCRGLLRGGAQVSPMHCNFLINTGTATAADLEGLGEEVRRRVFETSGVELDWEIKRIGVAANGLEAVR
jgi:UDP-N-acetylmuramate dehydrogenase